MRASTLPDLFIFQHPFCLWQEVKDGLVQGGSSLLAAVEFSDPAESTDPTSDSAEHEAHSFKGSDGSHLRSHIQKSSYVITA